MTPRTIPDSTIAALRSLLVRMVGAEPDSGSEESTRVSGDVRTALRELCDDAHDNDVRVEQLVIAIKQGWSTLHSDHPRTRAAGPDAVLNQVITLCIDEYFSERGARHGAK